MGEKRRVIRIPASLESSICDIVVDSEHQAKELLITDPLDEEERLNIQETLVVRAPPCPAGDPSSTSYPNVYLYHNPSSNSATLPNIRANRFCMSLGLFHYRLKGDVLLVPGNFHQHHDFLCLSDVVVVAVGGPDLRSHILKQQLKAALDSINSTTATIHTPRWILEASMNNFHDKEVIQKLASLMTGENDERNVSEKPKEDGLLSITSDTVSVQSSDSLLQKKTSSFDSHVPVAFTLCLECRKHAVDLCPGCRGAYFCSSDCRYRCWSHKSVCSVWEIYVRRRDDLGNFPYFPWSQQLTHVNNDCTNEHYFQFLREIVGVDTEDLSFSKPSSWWTGEILRWNDIKDRIDVEERRSYSEGFHPLSFHLSGFDDAPPMLGDIIKVNSCEIPILEGWDDYYKCRGIPFESPVALLLTFPLTLYYAIANFCTVPCKVSKMLKRSLRIHVVGAEKEIAFLDLFREVIYLMPKYLSLELTFCVYDLPSSYPKRKIELTERLKVQIVSGSYGDTIDPRFDIDGGSPDVVFGYNAGLFAYESWRSVIVFLHANPSIVGVFTDYNEFSGIQCAGLGAAWETLRVNPFRQPRFMPVYSMNLPQMCNGFFYIYNEARDS